MIIIAKSSSAEMVLEWLKAELLSRRFKLDLQKALQKLGKSESIITEANLSNQNENKVRLAILKEYRGWLDLNVEDYDWSRVELDRRDVSNLSYIDYDYWNELSGSTGFVKGAVENIKKGIVVFDVPNDNFYSVAGVVEADQALPPIILTSSEDGACKILEGHLRATGYALAKVLSKPLSAVLGILK
jgi:hypothetical protein